MTNPRSDWQPVIGIETHVQLKTRTKLFCGCDNDARGAEPNTKLCPLCLGLPGTLPVLNRAAVTLAVRAGLALNGQVASETKFDRKNYFYPDLPKGYQITQFDQPIVGEGWVEVPGEEGSFRVGIIRAHLEEDAGKLTHPPAADHSLVDLNRAGTPLLEIVSAPDIHSAAQAKAYAQEIYHLMRFADVSDADLYHGNMRFDVNISIRPADSPQLGTRTEIKNLNSFRSVERAVDYEISRQIAVLEKGERVVQETRGWDEAKGRTFSQRTKEEAHDYRYFPEPDLPPLVIGQSMLNEIKSAMPPLPNALRQQMQKEGVSFREAEVLIANPDLVAIYGHASQEKLDRSSLRRIVNWLVGEIQRIISDHGYDRGQVSEDAADLIQLARLVEDGTVSQTAAKQVISEIFAGGGRGAEKIAKQKKLIQVSGTKELDKIIDKVLAKHPEPVQDYKSGKAQALGFLVGQVMAESRGQANPQVASEMIVKKLGG